MLQTGTELEILAWLGTYALHSTLLLGAAWLVTRWRWARSERARERIWKTALVGGVLTATLQSSAPWETAGTWRFEIPATVAGLGERSRVAGPELAAAQTPRILEDDVRADSAAPPPVPSASTAAAQPADPGWARWALGAWAIGGALVLGAAFLTWRRLASHLAGARRVVDGPLLGLLALLRREAGLLRPVRVLVAPRLKAPIAMGTLFPRIYLPLRAEGLPAELQESMLAHELAHIARFDPAWLDVCRILETLLFFQPLNRLARRQLQECAEYLCDENAVAYTRNRIGMARCLAQVASWLVDDRRPLSACGMAELRSPLGARVLRILEAPRRASRRPTWTTPAGVALLAATVAWAPRVTGAPSEPATDPVSGAGAAESTTTGREAISLESGAASEAAERGRADRSRDPLDDLERVLADLAREQAALDGWIQALREEIEGRETPPEFRRRLQTIERRASSLQTGAERIRSLLQLVRRAAPLNTYAQ